MNQIFSRIAHSRTADDVVQQIEMLILEGVLRAGDRLPAEREMARQFEVSRPILREALKAIEARGLIATRPGGGTHVGDVIGQVFSAPVLKLIAENSTAARDYMEFRREMEGVAAELAARRATPEDRAMLAAIMRRMEEAHAAADFAQEAAIDVEFHNAIVECAHNIVLLHTLRACYRLLQDGVFLNRAMIYGLPGARDMLLAQHRAIHQAVATGNASAARQAARDHIDYVERAMGEAERSDDWRRVSRLRLKQRQPTGEPDIHEIARHAAATTNQPGMHRVPSK